MTTFLLFIITIAILVTIHEYGHFQVARWCGVKVLRFSIGFGQPLFKREFGVDRTEFVISAIPLGGYVKMLDERESNDDLGLAQKNYASADLDRAFNRQKVWKRVLIVLAGPVANLLLAVLLYWWLHLQGVQQLKPFTATPEHGTSAMLAGLREQDLILAVNQQAVHSWQEIQWQILQSSFGADHLKLTVTNQREGSHDITLRFKTLDHVELESKGLSVLGLKPYQPILPAIIGSLSKGGVAEKAGIKNGDQIVQVNGESIQEWAQLVDLIRNHPGQNLDIKLKRGDGVITVHLIPESSLEQGKAIGRIGAGVDMQLLDQMMETQFFTPSQALEKALIKTYETSYFSLNMFYNMLIGNVSLKAMSGPVTIASYAEKSASMGFSAYIGFLALVSISLGVLNLLPIPVLDGGHLLYYTIEIFKGSPIPDWGLELGQRIGLLFIGLLMACALYNDINRVITG